MATITTGNTRILIDEEGFLEEASIWNEDIARIIAEREGISYLSGDKLKIINFLRQYFDTHHNFPILGNVCKKTGAHSRDCVAQEFVDPMIAWKIAGLPKPPNIFFTSFDKKKFTPNPFY
jgi:tRNA 2-thiouridine synthesizing protein E